MRIDQDYYALDMAPAVHEHHVGMSIEADAGWGDDSCMDH